jgi:hypothetical protein
MVSFALIGFRKFRQWEPKEVSMGLFPELQIQQPQTRPRPKLTPSPMPSPAGQLPLMPELDFRPLDVTKRPKGGKLGTADARFAAFHAANPHVYENLKVLALSAKRSGQKKGSVRHFYEVLRYSVLVTTGDTWKLNNDFTPIYSRMIQENVPELRGFFEQREQAKKGSRK